MSAKKKKNPKKTTKQKPTHEIIKGCASNQVPNESD